MQQLVEPLIHWGLEFWARRKWFGATKYCGKTTGTTLLVEFTVQGCRDVMGNWCDVEATGAVCTLSLFGIDDAIQGSCQNDAGNLRCLKGMLGLGSWSDSCVFSEPPSTNDDVEGFIAAGSEIEFHLLKQTLEWEK